MDYTEVIIALNSNEQQEVVIALLSEIGYDSFMQEEQHLKAYVQTKNFNKEALEEVTAMFDAAYTAQAMPHKNWNQEWENNYDPVIVNEKVAVRAHFHAPITSSACNIIITPKMSFGTGHHNTTKLMLAYLSNMDLKNTHVLDYGCGTGVLGIYAALMGASSVVLCDIDEGCVQNTIENIADNQANNCTTLLGNIDICPQSPVDVLIANINLNVLTENMAQISARIKPGGFLLCSGFFTDDVAIITHYANKNHLTIDNQSFMNEWCALKFVKA